VQTARVFEPAAAVAVWRALRAGLAVCAEERGVALAFSVVHAAGCGGRMQRAVTAGHGAVRVTVCVSGAQRATDGSGRGARALAHHLSRTVRAHVLGPGGEVARLEGARGAERTGTVEGALGALHALAHLRPAHA